MKNYFDISIIIPFYYGNNYITNNLRKLNNCIEHTKTLKVEIIIVNDSPDCEVIYHDFPNLNIKVINNETNRGIHYSRVRGIKSSLGEYIIMLDQDDELAIEALSTQYQEIKDNDLVVANGFDYNPLNYGKIYHSGRHQELCSDLNYYFNVGCMIVSPGQCMIKKKAIPNQWIDYIIKNNGSDDLFLWILLIKNGVKIAYNNNIVYVHRYHGNNVSTDFNKMKKSSYEVIDYLYNQDIINSRERKNYYRRMKMREIYEGKNILYKIVALILYPKNSYYLIKMKLM